MLQSWNKLCFKGGHLEASISLPGTGETSGFWPGFWAMGNLGRPGYPSTTDGMWPYSYEDVCDAGITPNQSDPSGLSFLPGMKLPACTCEGTDHPNPGKSRSAPEIDAIEASVDPKLSTGGKIGTASQSYQIAPFDIFYSPNIGKTSRTSRSLLLLTDFSQNSPKSTTTLSRRQMFTAEGSTNRLCPRSQTLTSTGTMEMVTRPTRLNTLQAATATSPGS